MRDSLLIAFSLAAGISGVSLVCVAFDSMQYPRMVAGRWKWLLGLLIATIVFMFAAVLSNGRSCEDYTQQEYKYGEVPISCSKVEGLRNVTE